MEENLVLGALLWWKKYLMLLVTRFSLENVVSVSATVSAEKYLPIWVSVSVSDLNQNSGFGCTLSLRHLFSYFVLNIFVHKLVTSLLLGDYPTYVTQNSGRVVPVVQVII